MDIEDVEWDDEDIALIEESNRDIIDCDEEPGEDPDHDRKCESCGSKYCEGECKPLLIPNSTILPDIDEDWGGGFARNH